MEQPETSEAAWPAPPPYYLEALREPPAPIEGEFTMFGAMRTTGPPPAAPLERMLYNVDAPNPVAELRRLNMALLGAFIGLCDVMGSDSSACGARVDDVRHLLLNVQHLLNSLRPTQARHPEHPAPKTRVRRRAHWLSTATPHHRRGRSWRGCSSCNWAASSGCSTSSMPRALPPPMPSRRSRRTRAEIAIFPATRAMGPAR